jgi:aconitate hydratase
MGKAMELNVAKKLIASHLLEGEMIPGQEIGIRIDQTLTQDATGTLVMLEIEAMGLDRVKTEISAQYVDHNLIQEDHKNPDDHLFLHSTCRRFGLWYSGPGNGVTPSTKSASGDRERLCLARIVTRRPQGPSVCWRSVPGA